MIIETDEYDVLSPWGTDILITVRKASADGGLPEGVQEYILSGEPFDQLIIRADDLTDFSFLVEHELKIESLSLHCKYVDWDAVGNLPSLKRLSIGDGCSKSSLDFSKLKSLVRLDLDWNKSYEGLLGDMKALRALTITRFGMSSLESLGNMASLEYLALNHSKKVSCLDGLERFKKLKVLRLESNSQLMDISKLALCKNVELVFLNKNNKLNDYSPIGDLKKLKELTLVGSTDSVSWLSNLLALTHLRMDCKLEDGDLDFLYEMDSLRFVRLKDKKSQSLKQKEIQRHLEENGCDQKLLEAGAIPSQSSDYS